MNVTIHFNNQRSFVTIEVNDESHDDLLPSEISAQFVCANFLLQDFFGESHLTSSSFLINL